MMHSSLRFMSTVSLAVLLLSPGVLAMKTPSNESSSRSSSSSSSSDSSSSSVSLSSHSSRSFSRDHSPKRTVSSKPKAHHIIPPGKTKRNPGRFWTPALDKMLREGIHETQKCSRTALRLWNFMPIQVRELHEGPTSKSFQNVIRNRARRLNIKASALNAQTKEQKEEIFNFYKSNPIKRRGKATVEKFGLDARRVRYIVEQVSHDKSTN